MVNTYFIGDVHGCYDELMQLLRKIRFNHDKDRLIFVGDLINRGPRSLAVLRFVRSLGHRATVVLGNHDISLIAYAEGLYHGRGSDYAQLLAADDAQELLTWLRHQPILVRHKPLNVVVVHAGISPKWSIAEAVVYARKVEKHLQGKNYAKYLKRAYQKNTHRWSSDFNKYQKFAYRINSFARLRYCEADGEPDYHDKCPIGEQRAGLLPWFEMRKHRFPDENETVVFGHWAALGYYASPRAICLDSGCVWGGALTAISLDNQRIKRWQVGANKKY